MRPDLAPDPVSVPEVPRPGHHHRGARPVDGRDDLRVTLGAARLHERRDTGFETNFGRVGEWVERVRGADRSPGPLRSGLCNSQSGAVDTAHLTSADTDNRMPASEHDGIRLYVTADAPGEIERIALVVRRRSRRRH